MNQELNKYPYFIYPAVKSLREGEYADEAEATQLRRRIAANVGDTLALRLMLGVDPEVFASFYPDMVKAELSTTDTIDSFLSRFGHDDVPVPRAAAEVPPQAAYRLEEDEGHDSAPVDATSSAIDSFLASNPSPASMKPGKRKQPEKRAETMSEAQILIKNHDYQAALEIILQLNLNNPEKSIYFADQIRFLRKLILNQSKLNKV